MSKRQRGLSPTLFPFLAVLVCTLGTLILLLALVAQNATANAASSETSSPPQAAVNSITESQAAQLMREEDFRIEALIATRKYQTNDLESQREERSHLEDHIGRIQRKIKTLRTEIEISLNTETQQVVSDSQLEEISKEVTRLQHVVDELKENAEHTLPKVVIVPHQGPNGTDRRAVYLECDAKGLIIWPEGVRVTSEQLQKSTTRANPLDAALRTIRLHALREYGDNLAPYPLLIVRPEGIDSYGAARQAMQTWDDQFGYELVESELNLSFPNQDLNLQRKIEKAIEEACKLQQPRLSEQPRSVGNSEIDLHRSRPGGNLPTLSAAAMERASRANGYHDLRDYSAGSNFQPNRSANEPVEQGEFVSNSLPQRIPASTLNPLNPTASQEATPESPQSQNFPSRAYSNRPSYTSALRDPETGLGDSIAQTQERTGDSEANSAAWQEEAKSLNPKSTSTPGQSVQQGKSEAEIINASQADALGNASSSSNRKLAGETSLMDSNPISQDALPQDQNNQNAALNSQYASPIINPFSSSQSGGSSSSIGSALQLPNEDLENPTETIPPMNGQPPSTPIFTRPLISRTRNNWAVPSAVAQSRGNSIIRVLRVDLHHDRLVLLPSRNAPSIEVFSFFDGNLERASLQLATAIHERIIQWGPALPGGKWQPSLEVIVNASDHQIFNMFKDHFQGSGLQIIRVAPK